MIDLTPTLTNQMHIKLGYVDISFLSRRKVRQLRGSSYHLGSFAQTSVAHARRPDFVHQATALERMKQTNSEQI